MTDDSHHDEDVRVLHEMGYSQELSRRMGGFQNFAISFSIICILGGGIAAYNVAFDAAGGGSIGIGWIVGSVFALLVAAAMGQIASAYPTAGGLYHWSSILGGKGWGWATAWINLTRRIGVAERGGRDDGEMGVDVIASDKLEAKRIGSRRGAMLDGEQQGTGPEVPPGLHARRGSADVIAGNRRPRSDLRTFLLLLPNRRLSCARSIVGSHGSSAPRAWGSLCCSSNRPRCRASPRAGSEGSSAT
ncbi:MAG TPA: amino acid permease [Kofleriaceae bacterium]